MTGRYSRRNAQGAAQPGSERRATVRYHHSESIAVRCPSGSVMTGVNVEISEDGVSAMVNGLLLVGQVADLYPQTRVALWFPISGDYRGAATPRGGGMRGNA